MCNEVLAIILHWKSSELKFLLHWYVKKELLSICTDQYKTECKIYVSDQKKVSSKANKLNTFKPVYSYLKWKQKDQIICTRMHMQSNFQTDARHALMKIQG